MSLTIWRAHPAVLAALVATNGLTTAGYGEDALCESARKKILTACGCPSGEVYFLIGGTQANAVVIDTLLRPYQGVIAAASGHIAVHEAGAIEYGGHKVLAVPGQAGKLSAADILAQARSYAEDDNRDHIVMPGMVYLSQPTEYGTLYSLAELTDIAGVCRDNGLYLYVDGARLAYALASPDNDVSLGDLARLCDAFYIGGTKCGALFGEALVIPKKGLIPHLFSMIKQHGALLAKGRALGAQFGALFTDDLYLHIGEPAICGARTISSALKRAGRTLPFDTQTNQIFFIADDAELPALSKKAGWSFMEKTDNEHTLIRFATAWSTTDKKTDGLLDALGLQKD